MLIFTAKSNMEEEVYGIDKDHAHKRAIKLIPEEFFWDCADELAPFGSDEGDMALSEFRRWRSSNPNASIIECLQWTIESVGEIRFEEYDIRILDKELINNQIKDINFNDQHYIFTLDISLIATGFGQLVDEGIIEENCKPIIQLALNRQNIWNESLKNWEYKEEYLNKLKVLQRVLNEA